MLWHYSFWDTLSSLKKASNRKAKVGKCKSRPNDWIAIKSRLFRERDALKRSVIPLRGQNSFFEGPNNELIRVA